MPNSQNTNGKRDELIVELLKQEKDNIRNSCHVVIAWFAFSVGANASSLSEMSGPERPKYLLLVVLILVITNLCGAFFAWRVGMHVRNSIRKLKDLTKRLHSTLDESTEELVAPSTLYSLWARVLGGLALAKLSICLAWVAGTLFVLYGNHVSAAMTTSAATGLFSVADGLGADTETKSTTIRASVKANSATQQDLQDNLNVTFRADKSLPGARGPITTENTVKFDATSSLKTTLDQISEKAERASNNHARTTVMVVFLAIVGLVYVGTITGIVLHGVQLTMAEKPIITAKEGEPTGAMAMSGPVTTLMIYSGVFLAVATLLAWGMASVISKHLVP